MLLRSSATVMSALVARNTEAKSRYSHLRAQYDFALHSTIHLKFLPVPLPLHFVFDPPVASYIVQSMSDRLPDERLESIDVNIIEIALARRNILQYAVSNCVTKAG